MKYLTSRFLLIPFLAMVLTVSSPATTAVVACPMCKAANEEDDAKPRAYMYSILFMLTVPATIVSGVTFSLFKMSRSEADALQDAGLSDNPSNADSGEGSES
tara:strand:- start:117283 stop:117588 length:306 start_codon:yes stop_codon:yes gene_type:complete